jgi:hypothetical protein
MQILFSLEPVLNGFLFFLTVISIEILNQQIIRINKADLLSHFDRLLFYRIKNFPCKVSRFQILTFPPLV